jgi:hypothetical protein
MANPDLSSVVFTSAYRFSVLFSYSSLDPSYTLAPTVGWTAIEMAAGIISANLPALRPALRFIARKLGISGGVLALFRSTNGTRTKTTNGATQPSETAESATAITQRSKQSRHSFYHLPDDSGSISEQTRIEASFRPDYAKTYTNVKGPQVGHRSDDEIPLSEIRVDKEFMQTSTT